MATPEGGQAPATSVGGTATFADFLRWVCAGDETAAAELVQRYEPALRLEVRFRMTDPKLRRLLDPADLCQSVLKSFFVRAAAGQFELDSQEKLMALLRAMARNKIAHEARKQKAARRDVRRDVGFGDGEFVATDPSPSPSRLAIGRELLDAFQARLSAEERHMADLRSAGREWTDIAAELGGTPQARRKQLSRAVKRVSLELGLDGTSDEDD
jgi:RNA polymerase sigma factor (sigma-70 family)